MSRRGNDLSNDTILYGVSRARTSNLSLAKTLAVYLFVANLLYLSLHRAWHTQLQFPFFFLSPFL